MTVTYKTAQLSKEKGFNVPTREYWTKERSNSKEYLTTGTEYMSERDCIWDWNNNSGNGMASPYPNRESKYQCSAPEQHELQEWLLEKHGLFVSVQLAYNEWGKYSALIEKLSANGKTAILAVDGTTIFSNQYNAWEEGLYEALKLIK